ncbi:class I SAM-dependent RNA methyltransferase [Spongisporangium articulatum]|uniref:Class I SAM-dependent RNA methyltransferase n=1 Tax=Spongisporangium articulatum TaxID=3362603 RepID=A0ABW8AT08_9ACTN
MPDPELLELRVERVAHGGHCVARHEGRVVFVRHALPGELVRARLTEAPADKSFWRADAVDVLEPAPGRVEPRCPYAGPGRCGGCDWQHADLATQRELKAAVVAEQLQRLAGIERDVTVEPVPGDDHGLGWRTRVGFAVDDVGRVGLRAHRSHDVVPVEHCPIAHEGVDALGLGEQRLPGLATVEATSAPEGALVVLQPRAAKVRHPKVPEGTGVLVREGRGTRQLKGRTWVREEVVVAGRPRSYRVTGGGFWQVHPGAAQTFLDAVLEAADPQPGERCWDLYSGVGLFAVALGEAVGVTGSVVAVEGDERATADARRNVHDLPQVRCVAGSVAREVPRLGDAVDVVVLDPPRTGAGPAVVESVLRADPRVVVYVACDPAALARDLATATAAGYRLAGLRAFDAFPMTHHVECVATLVRA